MATAGILAVLLVAIFNRPLALANSANAEQALPPTRWDHATVWDPLGGRLFVFGGNADGYLNDIWSYTKATGLWQPLANTGAKPPPRHSAAAVWDTAKSRMLLFGGADAANTLGDFWMYDPESDRWSAMETVGPLPPPRYRMAYGWDPEGEDFYLFGGRSGGGGQSLRNDIWRFRANSGAWEELTPRPPVPLARDSLSGAWDPAHRQFLIFGGFPLVGRVTVVVNDLWAYNPEENAWTELSPSGDVPAPRISAASAWLDGQFFVFGGGNYTAPGGRFERYNEIWAYSPEGNAWRTLPFSGVTVITDGATAAANDATGEAYMFGGRCGPGCYRSEPWSFRSSDGAWFLMDSSSAEP